MKMNWSGILYDATSGAVFFGIPGWFVGGLILFLNYISPFPDVLIATVFFFVGVPLFGFFGIFFLSFSTSRKHPKVKSS